MRKSKVPQGQGKIECTNETKEERAKNEISDHILELNWSGRLWGWSSGVVFVEDARVLSRREMRRGISYLCDCQTRAFKVLHCLIMPYTKIILKKKNTLKGLIS